MMRDMIDSDAVTVQM